MKHRRIPALAIAVCLSLVEGASANRYFPNDATISETIPTGDDVIVGYANLLDLAAGINGTSPTVTIDAAGNVGSGHAYNGSTLNVDGGRVGGLLNAYEHATISLSSGGNDFGGSLRTFDQGTIIMSGGSIGSVTALDGGMLDVTGGVILARVDMAGAATGSLSGVTIGHEPGGPFTGFEGMVTTRDSSKLEMGAVVVILEVRAFNSSEIKMSSSTIRGGVEGLDATSLEIVSGSIGGGVNGFNLNMAGGTVAGGVGISGTGAAGTVSSSSIGGGVSASGAGATLFVSGGMVEGGASSFGGATLSLSSLQLGGLVNGFNSTVSAIGATISNDVSIQGNIALSTADIVESQIGGDLVAIGGLSASKNANITMTGGSVAGNVTANDRSSISLISATVGADVTANSSSPIGSLVDIQGSTIAGNAVSNSSGAEVRLSGGTIMGDLTASNRAAVTILDGNVNGKLTLAGRSSGMMGGGSVAGTAELDAITFTMTGGNIAGKVSVAQFSQFNFSNGTLGADLETSGESTTIMTGGEIALTALTSMSATLTISGGDIARGAGAVGESTLSISGGHIGRILEVGEQSTVNMSGGSVSGGSNEVQALINGSATLNLSGTALIDGELNGSGQSMVNFSGGGVKTAFLSENATINLSGSGIITDNVTISDSAKFMMSGGTIGDSLGTFDSSNVNITGGTIAGLLLVAENSTLLMEGGAVDSLVASGSSTVQLKGGTFSQGVKASEGAAVIVGGTAFIAVDLGAFDASTIHFEGGGVGGRAFANPGATLNVSGSAFVAGNLISQGTTNMSGGSVGGDVKVEKDGRLVLSGGAIAGTIVSTQRGDVAMTGGTVGSIEAQGATSTSGFTIGGGQILGDARAFNNSGILLVGGTIGGQLVAGNQSTVEMEGSAVVSGAAGAFQSATFNMRGGSVGVGLTPANLQAAENCTVNLSGGTVGGDLAGIQNGTVNMTGGTVFGRGIFTGKSKLNFIGGTIHGGIIQVPGLSPRKGGAPTLAITASDDATINIFGGALVATLVDPDSDGMSKYQLSGLLADGTVIDGGFLFVQNGTGATHRLVPGANWTIDGGGSWGGGGNWATATVPEGPGAFAQFPGVLTAPNSPAGIDLDGDRTLGSIRFDNANSYLIQPGSGGSLTLDNSGAPADITVQSGHHHITASVVAVDDTTAFIGNNASLSLAGGIMPAAGRTLTKTGDGELSAAFASGGMLNIAAGMTRILPESGADITTSHITVGADGILGGTGPFSAPIHVDGRLAPGNPVGTMKSNNTVTFGPCSGYNFEIEDWDGVSGTGYDTLTANNVTITATAASRLTVHVDGGALTNFSESPRTFILASAATALTGLTAANWDVTTANFTGTGTWAVQSTGNILGLSYSPSGGLSGYDLWIAEYPGVDPSPTADTDGDTFSQLLEYVLDGNPRLPGEPIGPVGVRTGNDFTFTFRRTDRSEGDTIAIVRYTTDLSQWTEVPIGAVSAGIVSITENGAAPDIVVVTIPAPGPRIFAQLLITRR